MTDEVYPHHFYFSTACLHDLHDRCRKTCKFCHESCNCVCHSDSDGRMVHRRNDALGEER